MLSCSSHCSAARCMPDPASTTECGVPPSALAKMLALPPLTRHGPDSPGVQACFRAVRQRARRAGHRSVPDVDHVRKGGWWRGGWAGSLSTDGAACRLGVAAGWSFLSWLCSANVPHDVWQTTPRCRPPPFPADPRSHCEGRPRITLQGARWRAGAPVGRLCRGCVFSAAGATTAASTREGCMRWRARQPKA